MMFFSSVLNILQLCVVLEAFFKLQSVHCEDTETYSYDFQTTIQTTGEAEPGAWCKLDNCPSNSIVTGFDIAYLPYKGTPGSVGNVFGHIISFGITYIHSWSTNQHDDQGVLQIYLKCTNVQTKQVEKWISGTRIACLGERNNKEIGRKIVGNLEDDNKDLSCSNNSPAIGFQIKNELHSNAGDNFGTINFKLVCSGRHKFLPDPDIRYDTVIGAKWSEPVMCPEGSAVCGIQPKLHVPADFSSESFGLTDVRLQCCPVKTINLDCTPEIVNKSVSYSKNCNGNPVTLEVRLLNRQSESTEKGTINTNSNGGSATTTFGLSVSKKLNLELVKAGLEARFEQQFGKHWNSVYENQLKNIDTKDKESEETIRFEIPAMHAGHVEQTVFKCGNNIAATKSLKIRNQPLAEQDCRKRRNL